MADIIAEILRQIPDAARRISDSVFEGANIILYTKDKDFFLNQNSTIKDIVNNIKKRIELRPDPSITMDVEKAEDQIRKLIPEEANITQILFDPQRSRVIIESEKPGVAIGKQGEVLRQIKEKTLWVPIVRRAPAIRSKMIENIRSVLYQNNDYRRKFLNKVGHRIYDGWKREKKHEWIRISFLGGARQVGRSCMLLQTPESRVLLDCGVNVAASTDEEAYPYLDAPEFNINDLDAVILSHPHVDHAAMVPYLYKMGYRGPTYCTAPARDVAALLALDYIGVSFKEARKAIYTVVDVKEMVKHTICLDYEEVTDVTPDIRITLYNAGHTVGSAIVHIHIGNGLHNLIYTGDFKYLRSQLLDPASTQFPRLETVMMESTYGAKEDVFQSRREAEAELIRNVKECIEQGGKVLIPVMGFGRAQEVMLIIEYAIRTGQLQKIPVYVHGMVWDITAIHTAYPDYLNKDVRKAIFHHDENPFLSDIFKRVGSRKEQQQLIDEGTPCVIVATSGMLTAGPALEYFRQLAENPRNKLIMVAYQAEGSLGRKIQNGETEIMMSSGEKQELINVKLKVVTISALSAHASRNELIRFVHDLSPKPKKIILVHGESSKCLELASALHKLNRIETVAPRNLETVRIR